MFFLAAGRFLAVVGRERGRGGKAEGDVHDLHKSMRGIRLA